MDVVNKYSQFIEIKSQINICRDADDNKFLDLTQDTNAEFLITGDQDLLSLKVLPEYQNKIITPREFITLD